jgi:acyl-CoA thioester hydrolase
VANCGGRAEISFSTDIRVYFQDTDAGNVVYHGAYLNFFERARTEWLRHLGFEQPQLIERFGVMFIVRSMELKFLRPARLDDLVEVSVDVSRMGRAQVTLAQEVAIKGAVLVRALVNLACVSTESFQPQPLPGEIGTAFSSISGTSTIKRKAT